MEWYRQVQFIAAVPMAEDAAEELGTTVNGMWAGPEARSDESVAHAHASGQRVLFSVPLTAVVPAVYQAGPTSHLLDEVCRDTQGNQALVPWYYWEPEPVYAACIYSPVFRRYLLRRCRQGIDRGMDVVNLDEINTSIGLMNQDAGAPGFCRYCLSGFRGDLREKCEAPGNGRHSPGARRVMFCGSGSRPGYGGAAAGAGGCHGVPVMRLRKTVRTSWPCLRAVSM